MRTGVPVDELTYAAGVSKPTSGNSDTSKFIKEITSTATRATNLWVITSTQKQTIVKERITQEELEIFLEGDSNWKQGVYLYYSQGGGGDSNVSVSNLYLNCPHCIASV